MKSKVSRARELFFVCFRNVDMRFAFSSEAKCKGWMNEWRNEERIYFYGLAGRKRPVTEAYH